MRNQSNSKSQNCKFFARMIAGQALQTFLLNSCPKYFRWGSRKKSARLVVKPYKGTRKNKSRKKYARISLEFYDKVGRNQSNNAITIFSDNDCQVIKLDTQICDILNNLKNSAKLKNLVLINGSLVNGVYKFNSNDLNYNTNGIYAGKR